MATLIDNCQKTDELRRTQEMSQSSETEKDGRVAEMMAEIERLKETTQKTVGERETENETLRAKVCWRTVAGDGASLDWFSGDSRRRGERYIGPDERGNGKEDAGDAGRDDFSQGTTGRGDGKGRTPF